MEAQDTLWTFWTSNVRQAYKYNYDGCVLTTSVSCRPINFINDTKDRWAYAAVFGTLSGTFVQLVFDSNLVSSDGYGDSILRGKCIFVV